MSDLAHTLIALSFYFTFLCCRCCRSFFLLLTLRESAPWCHFCLFARHPSSFVTLILVVYPFTIYVAVLSLNPLHDDHALKWHPIETIESPKFKTHRFNERREGTQKSFLGPVVLLVSSPQKKTHKCGSHLFFFARLISSFFLSSNSPLFQLCIPYFILYFFFHTSPHQQLHLPPIQNANTNPTDPSPPSEHILLYPHTIPTPLRSPTGSFGRFADHLRHILFRPTLQPHQGPLACRGLSSSHRPGHQHLRYFSLLR